MLLLPRKFLFAIEAVIDIAYHSRGFPVRNHDITRRQNIPSRYLEQLLQRLVRAGILASVRGPKGGYLLARERRKITLGDIRRSLNDEAQEHNFFNSQSALGEEIIRPLWQKCELQLVQYLDEVTIEQLCEQAHEKGIPSETEVVSDFAI